MFDDLRQHPLALALSVALHVALLGFMAVSIDWRPEPPQPRVEVVQAVVVSDPKIREDMAERRRAEELERQAEEDRRRQAQELERERQQDERRAKDAETRRKQEQQKAQEQRRQQELEAKRVQTERAQQEQARKKAEAEKRQAEEAAKKAEDKRRTDEAKKKAEADKRKQEEARRRAEEEDARRREMEAEDQRMAQQANQRRVQSEVDRYTVLIRQKVARNWLRPPNVGAGLSCEVMVRLIPGGEVVEARVVKSSGNAVFDRSVETAVFKAAPLPLPQDVTMFDYFRVIKFRFAPEE